MDEPWARGVVGPVRRGRVVLTAVRYPGFLRAAAAPVAARSRFTDIGQGMRGPVFEPVGADFVNALPRGRRKHVADRRVRELTSTSP